MRLFYRFLGVFTIILVLGVSAGHAAAPVGAWIVGRVSLGGGAPDYCSMKSRYDNGFIVVFARDARGGNSIAFDFQKDVLTPGQAYDVGLTVDHVVNRDYRATAATKQVVIVQIGADNTLYNALSRGSNMNVVVGGVQTLSLGLRGTAKGIRQLQNCMVNLAGYQPAMGSPRVLPKRAKAEPVEPVAVAPLSVRTQTDQLAELGRLRQERDRAVSQIAAMEKKLETQQAGPAGASPSHQPQAVAAMAKEPVTVPPADEYGFYPELSAEQQEVAILRHMGKPASQPNERPKSDAAISPSIVWDTPSAVEQPIAAEPGQAWQETIAHPDQIAPAAAPQAVDLSQAQSLQSSAESRAVGPSLPTQSDVDRIINLAEISLDQAVAADYQPTASRVSYNWMTRNLFGSASYQVWDQGVAEFVEHYVGVTKSRCSGDFAANVSGSDIVGNVEYISVDVACVSAGESVSAALLFYGQNAGVVGVVAHEGSTDQMAEAMTLRNSLVDAVKSQPGI